MMLVNLAARRIAMLGPVKFGAWVAVTGIAAFAPTLGLVGRVGMRQIILVAILALIVSGLNLSFGFAGELALGQAAIYAAGAYAAGYSAIHWQNELLLNLLLASVAALLIGIVTGVPGLRLGGWMLAVASFYMVLLVPDVLGIFRDELGGFNGLIGIPRPRLLGRELDDRGLYVAVIVVTAIWFSVFRNLVKSAHGSAFLVLRESPVLAQSLGISNYLMKLKAYALGAVPAGLAGCFFAYLDGFINPRSFGFELAILVLAASVLGGSESVTGALLGAVLLMTAEREFQSLRDYSVILYGVLLIIGGVFLGTGLTGVVRLLHHRTDMAAPEDMRVATRKLNPMRGGVLEASQVTKQFGGVTALDAVTLSAPPGAITALIGPNGSGKTTLLNVISGYYSADGGDVRLDGRSLSGMRPHMVARQGIARTFQTPSVPSTLSVIEAVETGRYSRRRVSMLEAILRLPRARRTSRQNREVSAEVLDALGIGQLAAAVASHLSLGTRRLVELARAVASEPAVLLLDEVASGLDEDELRELAAIIREIREAGGTVLLVEHNFALVRELADRIFVLADGRLIAEGTPDEIAAHPEVLQRYLGEPLASLDALESTEAPQ